MMCVLRNYAWPLRDRHGTAFGCFATRRISAQRPLRQDADPGAGAVLHCACVHAFTFLADVPHML